MPGSSDSFYGGLIKLSSRFGCHAACKAIPRVPRGVAIIACSRRNSSTECTGTVLVSLIFLSVSLDFPVSSLPFRRTRQVACFNSEFSWVFFSNLYFECPTFRRFTGLHILETWSSKNDEDAEQYVFTPFALN